MEHLLESLKCKSTRASTQKKYHEIWMKFNKFIISLDRRPALWENHVALYCAFLVEKGNKSTTIRTYISAIKKILKEDGYDWNDQIVLLNSLTKACRILNDKVKTRLPIQMGLFELLLFELDRVLSGQNYVVLLYHTLFSLAYYGLMRISELAVDKLSNHYIHAKNIHVGLNKNKILLVLYSLKTHSLESRPQKIKIETDGTNVKSN